jgi:hypothetical protein
MIQSKPLVLLQTGQFDETQPVFLDFLSSCHTLPYLHDSSRYYIQMKMLYISAKKKGEKRNWVYRKHIHSSLVFSDEHEQDGP